MVCKKNDPLFVWGRDRKIYPLGSPFDLMMPNCDPRDRFFYPTLTLLIDSYIMHEDDWYLAGSWEEEKVTRWFSY